MSTSPSRPDTEPLIGRQYEPSRLQNDSIISAYALVIPPVSRRLGPPGAVPANPATPGRGGDLRPSAAGA